MTKTTKPIHIHNDSCTVQILILYPLSNASFMALQKNKVKKERKNSQNDEAESFRKE